MRWLREWSPRYRREAWSLALADQGVHDPVLAEELGERYGTERRARHDRFADVPACLDELHDSHKLALITNGASCLQREKLTTAGLALLGSDREHAPASSASESPRGCARRSKAPVMVGDSLARDVDGATAAGLRAVWVNRSGSPPPEDRPDLVEISTLSELRGALQPLPS